MSWLASPVGKLAEGGQDEGVGDAFRAQAGAQIHRVDEGDAALTPMLALLEQIFSLRVNGRAGGSHGLVVGVEEDNGDEFAGLDEFIGAAVDQFVEHRFEAFLGNDSSEAHAADDGAEGVGDVFGAVAQVGSGGLLDPEVFLDLPAQDQRPDGPEESVNQQAAASQFHSVMPSRFQPWANQVTNLWEAARAPVWRVGTLCPAPSSSSAVRPGTC